MPSLMSVTHTVAPVVARQKTVTRRLGWERLKPGTPLTLCRKVQGRRRPDGTVEPLVRLAEVVVVSVRTEPLNAITAADVTLEGFSGWTTGQFVEFFTRSMRCAPDVPVNRIEWRYLNPQEGQQP